MNFIKRIFHSLTSFHYCHSTPDPVLIHHNDVSPSGDIPDLSPRVLHCDTITKHDIDMSGSFTLFIPDINYMNGLDGIMTYLNDRHLRVFNREIIHHYVDNHMVFSMFAVVVPEFEFLKIHNYVGDEITKYYNELFMHSSNIHIVEDIERFYPPNSIVVFVSPHYKI